MTKEQKAILLLFLTLIICSVFVLTFEKGYALDEVTDDYINYDSVQARNNIVRNTTFNCMELSYGTLNVSNADMDIWTSGGFTIVDPAVQHIFKVNITYIWFNDVDRDEGDRIFKDFGANMFDLDFHYHFRVKIPSTHTSNARCYFMAFSEETDSIYNTIIADKNYCGFFTQWRSVTSKWEVQLRMWDGTTHQIDINTEDQQFDLNRYYHVDYLRDGNNITAWFYNDALMTDLDFMLTISASDVDNLRYFHPLNAEDQAVGGRAMDLHLNKVHNFTLSTGYADNGYFYTTELISGIGGNTVVLLTNSTIPAGDIITVEFSSDNITWLDHNGNVGSDTLVAGNESIDIRDLSYTTLYTRFYYTDIGADSTPRLYQIKVITDAIISGGIISTGWILGIFILVPSIALLIMSKKRGKR